MTRDGRPVNLSDRDRIIAATLDVVAAIGFDATKVNDIIATAGMGRRTFWSYFSGKTAALAAGYDQITRDLRAAVQQAHDAQPDPAQRIVACLAATAEFLASDPARAEVLLVQGPCAGREVIEVRTETMRRLAETFVAAVTELAPWVLKTPDRSQIVVESLAGGFYEVAYMRTVRGDVGSLPALVPEMAQLILTPYLGRDAAQSAIAA